MEFETQKTAQHILKIAQNNGADFAEVVVTKNEFSLKRIKQGQVDQPPAAEQWGIDLTLVKNERQKTLSFDNPQFAEDNITTALKFIDLLPKQEILSSTIFETVLQPEQLYDPKTAELSGKGMIEIVRQTNQELAKHNILLSGKIAQGKGEISYENFAGTKQTAAFTLATAAFFGFDKDNQLISSFANSGGASVDNIDSNLLISELIHKCSLARGKERIDLFADTQEGKDIRITVIVEPYFLEPIFEWLGFFGFNGLFVEQGESFISGKINQQVTGSNITITDDPYDTRNTGMGIPFDFEGRPRKALPLIENGIAKNAVYDKALAHKWRKSPTGHALLPSQRSEGAAPFNLVVKGGDTSVEEMIKQTKDRALWITKVHYLGMKHHQTATMTGIAQHGVFLIENGEVKGPVENLRFEESIPEALKRVEALSPARLIYNPVNLNSPGGVVIPAMKIKDFRFIGSTKRTV